MKIQFFKRGSLGLMVAMVPLVGGCDQQTDRSPQGLVTVAFAEPAIQALADSNATPAAAVPEAPSAPPGKAKAAPASLDEKPLPPSIKAIGPVAEVIKLAQAGVDERIMLTFITNSSSTFSLGSDEIIYLNDLGVPNDAITAMIEHDQAAKQSWADTVQAQAAAAAAATTVSMPEEQAAQTAAATAYVNPSPVQQEDVSYNSYNYFQDTLSPYGSWINVDGYGMCWQPTVVVINRGWQPYCDRGRWVYSDCGWYWLSDYSWGWATFHYGRWFNHPRVGWCWWPDRVWAPSWVSWRYNGDYCGWAPLPPAAYYRPGFGFSFRGSSVGFSFDFGIAASWYTFVPLRHIIDPRPSHYRVSPREVTRIFNNTTVINNFGSGNNNRVINHGIPPERITQVAKTEIRRVTIRDVGASAPRSGRPEQLERDGRTLTVHQPPGPSSTSFGTRVAPTTARGEMRRDVATSTSAAPFGQPQPGLQGAKAAAPESSLTIIGRRGSSPARSGYQVFTPPSPSTPKATENRTAPSQLERTARPAPGSSPRPFEPQNPPLSPPATPTPRVQPSPAAPSYNKPSYQQPQVDRQERSVRQEIPAISRSIADRSVPRSALPETAPPPRAYSAPAPVDRPQYNPSPAYRSAPQVESRSAPAPAPAPAPRAPDRSPSSGGGGASPKSQDSGGRGR